MKKKIKQSFALLLAIALLLALSACGAAKKTLADMVRESAAYLTKTVPNPQVDGVGGEWAVLGLARADADVPDGYFEGYYQTLEQTLRDCGGELSERKYSEYSRVILALTAIGKDPSDVAGYNLLMRLGDYDKTVYQGLNGPIWALIAQDSGNYEIPQNPDASAQATRERYLQTILDAQLPDGGWAFSSDTAEPDMTAMALQALRAYRGQPDVDAAIERGVACLSALQDSEGGYSSWGTANSESAAQVIVALTSLGISLDDERFVKNEKTVLDALLCYRDSDGSFRHTMDGKPDGMATEQGFYAMTAALRAQNGKSSLYDMMDVSR